MKEMPLTQGMVALVDDEDFGWLSQWEWRYKKPRKGKTGYAFRTQREGSASSFVLMHRAILGALPGQETDHEDHDGLNNQRHNLRICSHAQNQGNLPLYKNNTSGYRGVHFDKDRKTWTASVGARSKKLGRFPTAIEAAKAYDRAAREKYGVFACLNFPGEVKP